MVILGIWGATFMSLDAFMKLWVKYHVAQYIAFVQTWPARVLAVVVAALLVLACPLGLAMAIRGWRHSIVRIAAVLASIGYLSILTSWVPGLLQKTPQITWPLYWVTLVAVAGVVLLAVVWWILLEERMLRAAQATRSTHAARGR